MQPILLNAASFIKPMSNGRTQPLLLGCENASGETFEVVVKFRGRELNEKTQTAELISAQLADDLGLQVPQAALVEVPVGFEAVIPHEFRDLVEMVRRSPGLNFGSIHLGTGFTTWPPGRNPVGAQRDQAAEIFAFDTLVQNPDRRAVNPNLWSRSDRIGVYDHEQAFSFLSLQIIGGAPRPWMVAKHGNSFDFLKQHIFYQSLRGSRLNLGPFEEKLGALADKQLRTYVESVPAAWNEGCELAGKIVEYLQEAREERANLVNFIKHLLR